MDKIYLLLHSGSAHSLSSDILARQRFKEANNITNNWICLNIFSLILIHVSSWLHQDWVNWSAGACAQTVLPTHWQLSVRRPDRSQAKDNKIKRFVYGIIFIKTLIFLHDTINDNANDPVVSLNNWKLARFPLNKAVLKSHQDSAKTTIQTIPADQTKLV